MGVEIEEKNRNSNNSTKQKIRNSSLGLHSKLFNKVALSLKLLLHSNLQVNASTMMPPAGDEVTKVTIA